MLEGAGCTLRSRWCRLRCHLRCSHAGVGELDKRRCLCRRPRCRLHASCDTVLMNEKLLRRASLPATPAKAAPAADEEHRAEHGSGCASGWRRCQRISPVGRHRVFRQPTCPWWHRHHLQVFCTPRGLRSLARHCVARKSRQVNRVPRATRRVSSAADPSRHATAELPLS